MNCHRLEDDHLLADLTCTPDARVEPCEDDREQLRGDQQITRLDEHVEQCEDCRERLRGYQEIARWISQERTAHRLPPDWKRRMLARIDAIQASCAGAGQPAMMPRIAPAEPKPVERRRHIMASALAAASAALLVLLVVYRDVDRVATHDEPQVVIHRGSSDRSILAHPQLAMRIVEDSGERSSRQSTDPTVKYRGPSWPQDAFTAQVMEQRFDARPGQVIQARALAADARYFEIRVYRGARDLLVRCPEAGPPICIQAGGSLFDPRDASAGNAVTDRGSATDVPSLLVWRIPSVSTYQVVLLVSRQPITPPRGSLNDDVTAARAAGARVITVGTVHVH
jgi:hypothetical protein